MAEREEMTFLEHLEELRWHIIRSIIAVALGMILMFVFKDFVFDSIMFAPRNPDFLTNKILCHLAGIWNTPQLCINQGSFELISITMSGQFNMHIFVSIVGGIVLAFPYIFWEFWRFVAPALKETERKYAKGVIFFVSTLFFMGILFGYYVITPFSIDFLGSYRVSSQVANQISLTSYLSTMVMVILASGIIFELPILVFFLTKIGLITPTMLRKYRKHSLIGILIISAIITPPDVFSQILVSIPLLFLYEAGILISVIVIRKNKQTA